MTMNTKELAEKLVLKGQGRMQMTEPCVYQVKDGKVISEQFYV